MSKRDLQLLFLIPVAASIGWFLSGVVSETKAPLAVCQSACFDSTFFAAQHGVPTNFKFRDENNYHWSRMYKDCIETCARYSSYPCTSLPVKNACLFGRKQDGEQIYVPKD